MLALNTAIWTYTLCGNYGATSSLGDELVLLADGKTAAFWKACGMLHRGWLFSLTSKPADAVPILKLAIASYKSTGATLFDPERLSNLAGAYADLGRFCDAWQSIDEAMATIKKTKEKIYGMYLLLILSFLDSER